MQSYNYIMIRRDSKDIARNVQEIYAAKKNIAMLKICHLYLSRGKKIVQ